MVAFDKAEAAVEAKAEELNEISKSYEKAKNLADKIQGVEVDIIDQLQGYTKVQQQQHHHNAVKAENDRLVTQQQKII